MKLLERLMPHRQTYEQRVDRVVEVLGAQALPVQLFFLKDGIALGTIKRGDVHFAAPLNIRPTGVINADYPRGLQILQEVLKRVPTIGHQPKSVIKAALTEAWRRKFNELQIEKAAQDKAAGEDRSYD